MRQPFSAAAKHSFINRISPAARLASCLMFAVVTAITQSTVVATAALVMALCITPLCNPPMGDLIKRWVAINLFVLFMWFLTPWAVPGEPIYAGSIITKEGLWLCLLITLKANALFFAFTVLISSMTFTQMAKAMEALRLPARLCLLVLFTARGIRIFFNEYERIRNAETLRGFVKKCDMRTYRTVSAVVALIFFRAVRRGEILQEAMILRGFDGTIRTLNITHWSSLDTAFTAFFALLSILLLAIQLL